MFTEEEHNEIETSLAMSFTENVDGKYKERHHLASWLITNIATVTNTVFEIKFMQMLGQLPPKGGASYAGLMVIAYNAYKSIGGDFLVLNNDIELFAVSVSEHKQGVKHAPVAVSTYLNHLSDADKDIFIRTFTCEAQRYLTALSES
jgi:hypothetical protein